MWIDAAALGDGLGIGGVGDLRLGGEDHEKVEKWELIGKSQCIEISADLF